MYGYFGSGLLTKTLSTPRQQALLDALEQRILVIDGAMGTMIHEHPLSIEKDFLGRENCPEILVETRPDLILGIHRAYLEAGADIVETDTFGGTPVVLAEFDLRGSRPGAERQGREARAAGRRRIFHARQAALRRRLHGTDTKDLNVTVTRTFDKMRDSTTSRPKALVEGGADICCSKPLRYGQPQSRPAGVERLRARARRSRFRDGSVTMERNGTMLGRSTD